MSEGVVQLRLYVAGGAPNSNLAISNLNLLCQRYLPNRHETEIVDVWLQPQRALDDGIFLTPQLFVLSATPKRTIVGNLSEYASVLLALGVTEVSS